MPRSIFIRESYILVDFILKIAFLIESRLGNY